jgi:hypothetical protein
MRLARVVAVLGLIACDAGVRTSGGDDPGHPRAHRPHTVSRNKLDMQGLPIPLPKHGLAVQTFGMGGYFDLEVIDTDAKTIRVIAENWDREKGMLHLDKTLPLGATDLKKLVDLSDRAWREDQHGKMPQITDVAQHLFIVDGDDAFSLQADLIGLPDVGESSVRPNASALVLAVLDLASAPLTPPLPTPPEHKHSHAIDRATLQTSDTQTPLPLHGLVVHRWDLAGDETIVIDSDQSTLRVVSNAIGKKQSDVTSKHDAKQLTDVMHLAVAAWHEDGAAMQAATDVREDLYVLDGDEAFYVSGHPISAEAGQTGRPAASLLMTAVYRVAH